MDDGQRFGSYVCCNPFNYARHCKSKKDLRKVAPWMIEKKPMIDPNSKICSKCRKELKNWNPNTENKDVSAINADPEEIEDDNPGPSTTKDFESDSDEADELARNASIDSLNSSLVSIGETPIKKKRFTEGKYPEKKAAKIDKAVKKVLRVADNLDENEDPEVADAEVISQIKEKFKTVTTNRSTKLLLLTLLPKSWSIRKTEHEFPDATNYMIRQAKALVKDHGILTSPNPKSGKSLDAKTVEAVTCFYSSDEVSRMMPGKKDCVSMNVNGQKVQQQKRLILGNLREIYKNFKDVHGTNYPIGFSKFASLRPKNCVLAGSSGTHSVCVCTTHQNVKLMLEASKISQFSQELSTYKHFLSKMICNPPLPQCCLKNCEFCPGTEFLKNEIISLLELNSIDEICYKQWVFTDRSNLETLTSTVEEFVDILMEKLCKLQVHAFVAEQQSLFLKEAKQNLENSNDSTLFIILCDFAENYSFVLQDASQGYHWNNAQATIHPFSIYHFNPNTSETCSDNLVVISDVMKHDTVSVFTFQKELISFLKNKYENIQRIMYFSDGAASQYKNRKNFLNLLLHKTDFGIAAEWHFFASSHGKSTCDGLGGTLKRLAARASLQRPYNDQIMTPRQLYNWAVENIKGMNFVYVTNESYSEIENTLTDRFVNARQIPGTQKLHCIIPVGKNILRTKLYSASNEFVDRNIWGDLEQSMPVSEIKGFVTCVYNNFWWLCCVMFVDEEKEEVSLNCLHPHGPSPSFVFPQHPDQVILPLASVLTKVDPTTTSGRTYKITPVETQKANQNLQEKLPTKFP